MQLPQPEMKGHTAGILGDTGPLWTPAAPHTLQGRGSHPDWFLLSPHNYRGEESTVLQMQTSTSAYLLHKCCIEKNLQGGEGELLVSRASTYPQCYGWRVGAGS